VFFTSHHGQRAQKRSQWNEKCNNDNEGKYGMQCHCCNDLSEGIFLNNVMKDVTDRHRWAKKMFFAYAKAKITPTVLKT
jgi:hypothetical protein